MFIVFFIKNDKIPNLQVSVSRSYKTKTPPGKTPTSDNPKTYSCTPFFTLERIQGKYSCDSDKYSGDDTVGLMEDFQGDDYGNVTVNAKVICLKLPCEIFKSGIVRRGPRGFKYRSVRFTSVR